MDGSAARKGYLIGVDVGGTKTAYGLFDSKKRLIGRRRHPSDEGLEPAPFFDVVAANVRALMEEHGLSAGDVRGLGIGMPSFIRFDQGKIVKTSNLTRLRDFAARDYLSERLGIPVALGNDSHAAALAEHRQGAGRGFENMLFCPVSTGVSSAMIIGGKLFRGSYGCSGESGHMIATPGRGILCGCGNRGCFMSYCSGSMIVKHIRSWIGEGGTTVMTDIAGSPDAITAEHILAAYDLNDPMAFRAVEQMAHYMGVWLFNVYVLLNINCFVFGGGLLNFGNRLFGRVRAKFDGLNGDSAPVYFKETEVGADLGIIGAAELVDS